MLPVVVIDRQVAGQPAVPLFYSLVFHGVGPFAAEGLNEPLRLPLSPGRVGLLRMRMSRRVRQVLANALET